MPKGIPLTGVELERRRHEIFNASVHLFLKKGFQETSMQEIARAAGMGKSSLYDYFKTKDEILVSVLEDEFSGLNERARLVAGQNLPAAEKLRQVIRIYPEYLLEQKDFYTKLISEIDRLDIHEQARLQIKRHAYQDLLCTLIEQAIQDGTFRPVTPLLAARIALTLVTPAVFTTRPTGTAEQMMDEAIDIFFQGIMA
jgi:AcrR family transcriptional regulator